MGFGHTEGCRSGTGPGGFLYRVDGEAQGAIPPGGCRASVTSGSLTAGYPKSARNAAALGWTC